MTYLRLVLFDIRFGPDKIIKNYLSSKYGLIMVYDINLLTQNIFNLLREIIK